MERKQAEADFANMMNRLALDTQGQVWHHKWADARYCPFCKNLLYKVEDAVDYTIVVGTKAGLTECKQDLERFYYSDEEKGIRPGQRKWLNEWQLLGRDSWIFLELGDGRAPKDRNAWLIWWPDWLYVETTLEVEGKRSLTWRPTRQSGIFNATEMLAEYQMTWAPGAGFVIPKAHLFYRVYPGLPS